MFPLKKLLAALILPPAGPLLLAALGLTLATLAKSRRWRYGGGGLAALALGVLFGLSLPVVSHALIAPLQRFPQPSPASLSQAQAIVVLGGGERHSLQRIHYAARLARQTGLPLLVTGGAPRGGQPEGEAMAEILREDFALSLSLRWVETASRDTAENATYSAALLKPAQVRTIVLVSHAWHLPRAVPLFTRQGFTVIPAPAADQTLPPSLRARWLPSSQALDTSALALNEYLGGFFYRLFSYP